MTTLLNRSKIILSALAVTLALGTALATLTLTGCRSAQDKANDAALAQAEQIAASTGTPQRVTWTDPHGNTVTSIVQPPAPGQTQQQITTTTLSTKTSDGNTTQSTTTSTRMVPLASAPPLTQGGPAPGSSAAIAPGYAPGSPDGPAAGTQGGGPYPLQQAGGYPSPQAGAYPANDAAPGNGTYPNGANPNGGPQGSSRPVITPVDVHIRRGTTLAIRINQHISVKTTRAGEGFTGEVVRPVYADGTDQIAIPSRTPVYGVVDAAHRRGHFKGRSILELRLTSMELNGRRYALDTSDDVRTKKGKGKRTAALIGGGAGLGMLVGGVASGGVGLLVGGLAGGGAGTAISGLTGNRDIEIPAESVVNFRLADDLVVQPQ